MTLPSQDVNGEAGTIQAGEYAKGDTATFFLVPGEGKVSVRFITKLFFSLLKHNDLLNLCVCAISIIYFVISEYPRKR